jgi:signal transduction histidine kinase
MNRRLRIPIRVKILVTLLFVVTAVVSVITFTMATMFHQDKKAYINDLASIAALSAAEEARTLLGGYTEGLRVHARIMQRPDLSPEDKTELLRGFFQDLRDLIGVRFYRDGELVASVYDDAVLVEAGVSREEVDAYRAANPLPMKRLEKGEIFVENSTLSRELPMLSLSFLQDVGERPVVVSALVRLDGLARLAARTALFRISLIDSKGSLLAHPDPEAIARREQMSLPPRLKIAAIQQNAGMTLEFEQDGVPSVGGFASVDIGGVVAAATVPASSAYLASHELLSDLMLVAFVLLLIAVLIGQFGSYRITRPVEKLSAATREIAKGQFAVQVDVASHDEIGTLASSFNQMASELEVRDEALEEAQAQLLQSEKMAAFGQLGAGIAHEVKNPLAGILGCAQLSVRKSEEGSALHTNLVLIEKETKRCQEIIENLLRFARQEKAVFESVQLNGVVDDAAAIIRHQLGVEGVELILETADDLPMIKGNANQMQQVLMNLMMNAQQAMTGDPGTIMVSTRRCDDDHVEIAVSDTGPGISEESQRKIFEPFFTTKPGGRGTGLGLSVSFGIVKDHGGEISLQSTPGKRTTFTIRLPVEGKAPVLDSRPGSTASQRALRAAYDPSLLQRSR